jgi:predicted enzyme involved in methoxymalonyl-ACP biosynthesis
VVRFANDTSRLLLTVHAGDRFGDQGLVAFVQAVIDGDTATITDWVMSCRTMNRRLEFAVEEQLEKCLTGRGVATICASWRKTLKNAPVSGLFESFGFELLAADEVEKRYVLKVPRKAELVHQVKIKGD